MALATVALDTLSAAIQRAWSQTRDSCGFTSAEFRQAMDDMDGYIEANQTAINLAFNAGFRAKATLIQKTLVFCYVAMKRAGLRVGGE